MFSARERDLRLGQVCAYYRDLRSTGRFLNSRQLEYLSMLLEVAWAPLLRLHT
jgi:hypothetical protein